jgi:hypothetical protein
MTDGEKNTAITWDCKLNLEGNYSEELLLALNHLFEYNNKKTN